MKPGFLLGVFLFLAPFAQAQFSDSITHQVRLSAAGNLNRSTNVTAYLLTNDARFSVRNKRTTLNTAATWLYGEQGSTLTNNDFSTTADFNLYRDSSKLYYWALANYVTSYSLKINNQLQTGLGAAYNFLNNATAWLNLSEGVLYETSSLATGDPSRDKYQTLRNSLRLSYRFALQKAVTFSGANYYQQAFSDGSDNIVRTSNSLSVKLSSWISVGATLTYNRFRRTNTENMLITYGIVAEKFF